MSDHIGRWISRLLAALVIVALAACGDDDPQAGDVVAKEALSLTGTTAVASAERLTYRMPAVGGDLTDARTAVLIPNGTPPSGGWPIVAWGHGTTGVGDACAPSDSATLASYVTYLDALVGAGYAVVAPDYEGLGTDGLHPYLSLASQGRSLLYAVQAAVREYSTLSKRFALVGHSQGGHAVIGAAELAAEVGELTLMGTVAIAPASNIAASGNQLLAVINNTSAPIPDRVAAGVGRVLFSSLIAAAIPATDASFDPATAYGSAGGFLVQSAATACLTDLSAQITPVVQAEIVANGSVENIVPAATTSLPAVAGYLSANEPGSKLAGPSILLLQGSADTTVFPAFTQLLNGSLQASGNTTTYTEFSGETHSSIVQASAAAALSYLGTAFAN